MEVEATTVAPEETGADTIVVGLLEGGRLDGPAAALVESGEARGAWRRLALAHADGRRWLVVGLGPEDELDGERVRGAAAAALGRLREVGARVVCWVPPDGFAGAVVEGTLLAAYRFT